MSAPDPKAKKYDRQLRIWGAHGQAALESACICLLHCGPTGTETLKNLVLGGIASFTVVDASKVRHCFCWGFGERQSWSMPRVESCLSGVRQLKPLTRACEEAGVT